MATKMDIVWIAAADLIHPNVSVSFLVKESQVFLKINVLFPNLLLPQAKKTLLDYFYRDLLSHVDRNQNQQYPPAGGSRNRYLFRTSDGSTPNTQCDSYRLYKKIDTQYDGIDKTGKVCPDKKDIPIKYHYLIDWYQANYY